ncbi:hypothetical protein FRC11_002965, partial [Ceratobasidium sp. 423]
MSGNNLLSGTLLAASEVANVANLPLVQDVAHHIGALAAALKPSVLQAPKDNDTNARELAECVKQLVDALDRAFADVDMARFFEITGSERVFGHLVKLQELRGNLGRIHSELQKIIDSRYRTKLASQSRIRDRIHELKEELWQNYIQISACMDTILMHICYTMTRAQLSLSQQVRELDHNCQRLASQANAMYTMRPMGGHEAQ